MGPICELGISNRVMMKDFICAMNAIFDFAMNSYFFYGLVRNSLGRGVDPHNGGHGAYK